MSAPNPYKIVSDLEDALCEYSGSKFAVALESGSAAILLSLFWFKEKKGELGVVQCPKFSYPSIPCSIILMGGKVQFTDEKWDGIYRLNPYPIIDGALRFRKGMYKPGTFHMISAHQKKIFNLGRGGAILLDDKEAYEWLKRARFDGRAAKPLREDLLTQLGFNVYMEPTTAARGIQWLQANWNKEFNDLPVEEQGYSDLSVQPAYQKYTV